MRRSTRLDRGLCVVAWTCRFLKAAIKHLACSYSDHRLMILQLDPGLGARLRERPFKFQSMWLRHKDFPSRMKDHWTCGESSYCTC